MVYISFVIIYFSLIILWGSSIIAGNKMTVYSKIPLSLLILLLYKTGINMTWYLYFILFNTGVLGPVCFLSTAFSKFLTSSTLFISISATLSLLPLIYILLVKRTMTMTEKSARAYLDAFPGKSIEIERKLAKQIISNRESKTMIHQLEVVVEVMGAIDGISKLTRMEFFVNAVFMVLILFLISINVINRAINNIIVFYLLGYFIPALIVSTLILYLVKKLEKIY